MKMQPTARALAALAMLSMAAGAASAAVNCRMPNGKTIALQTATQCPPDADQLDEAGRVLRPARRAAAPPAAVRKEPPPRVVVAPPPRPVRSAFEMASAFCELMRGTPKVSECRVESNIFSASTVDLTITSGLSGPLAWADCVGVAKTLREQAPRAFADQSWLLRYFSPYSGERPIATCDL